MEQDLGENYSVARIFPEIAAEMKTRFERAKAKYEPLAGAFAPYTPPSSAAEHPD